MNRLIEFALTQRVLVILGAILLAGFGWSAFRQLPIDAFPDVSPDPGEDHRQGAGDDARGGRKPDHDADRTRVARHPQPGDAAVDRQVRAVGHHGRLRRGHGYLLGPPAGRRATGRCLGEPAGRRRGRHRTDDHAARRDVHVHGRWRPQPGRAANGARLDDSAGPAHGARRGGRQFPGRLCSQLRGHARPSADGRARRRPADAGRGARRE